ncbi:MAG: tRNA (adenosine(37)-N6)-threonylcarbamoyltransferase complex ATPase subunit type 1 TsaE [Gammaproteobacteria bacterium]
MIGIADAAAMEDFGARVARACSGPLSIYLQGGLGSGKTTFVRGFLRALGHEDLVKSPTYTLVEPYELPHINAYHFDLYRLADPRELEFVGARDFFDGESICLVEWPERAGGALPGPDLLIRIAYADYGRSVEVEGHGAFGQRIADLINIS